MKFTIRVKLLLCTLGIVPLLAAGFHPGTDLAQSLATSELCTAFRGPASWY
jgi:hypothetical protein